MLNRIIYTILIFATLLLSTSAEVLARHGVTAVPNPP